MINEKLLSKLKQDDALLGAYDYLNLHTLIRHWPPLTRTEVEQAETVEERANLSLGRYAYIHETRHFHDFFGTMAGISLFFSHFEMVRSFAILFQTILPTGEKWLTPFPSWAVTSKFQDLYARFLKAWSLYRRSALRFTQAFRPLTGPQPSAEDYVVYLDAIDADDMIATFPFDLGIAGSDTRFGVYYPISLVALLEGNAQAIQRSLAEAEFAPEIARNFTPQKIDHRVLSQVDGIVESVASTTQPYNVTDFMVSKYLRLAGQSSFRRETIIRLTDIALGNSAIIPLVKDDLDLPKVFQVHDVGRNFVDALKATGLEDLKSGKVEYPSVLMTAYSDFLEKIIDFEKPEDIEYRGDLLSSLTLLESTIRHGVMAPLVRLRIATQHKVFYSSLEYLKRFPELPKVPVMEHSGGVDFAPYMSDKAIDAWSKYIFLSRIVSELGSGSHVLTCPRADRTVGATGGLDFCFAGDCKQHISQGKCDGWYGEKLRPLPNCLFAASLKVAGADL